jgi:undecaprenyl-diphosphatase
MAPLAVELDGRPMRVWLAWIGNGRYGPAGLAPAYREDLADGLLDLRIVHGARRFSRTRFALSALSGRLARSHVYTERTVATVDVRGLEGPLRLAADGETFDAPSSIRISKRAGVLLVAVPPD